MSDSNRIAHPLNRSAVPRRGLLAPLFGLVAFMALGALVLLYMADAGADVILAVIAAVTPGAPP
jgi:hypothetical protein